MLGNVVWRRYQEPVVERIIESLRSGRVVLLDSPTGSGKTLMVLYSTLKYGFDEGLRVVVCVRTRSQMNAYLREIKRWFKGVKPVFLVSKKDACPIYAGRSGVESIDIDCRRCPLRDQVSVERVLEAFSKSSDVLLAVLELNSSTPPICTYGSLRELVGEADVVVVSYPYVFDPSVREPTIGDILPDSILVVDEAHNIDRLPDMYERRITRGVIEQALIQARNRLSDPLRKRVVEVISLVREKVIEVIEGAESEGYEEVELELNLSNEDLELLSDASSEIAYRIALEYVVEANWVKRLYDFLYHLGLPGFKAYRFVERGYKFLAVKPVEPAILTSVLGIPRRLVLMSGTLPDREYVMSVWGISGEVDYIDVEEEYGPVFPNSRRLWVIVWDVTSKWEHRGEEMWSRYARLVENAYKLSRKNVLVIATSYAEAKNIARYVSRVPLFLEERNTVHAEVVEFARKEKGVILAVASGKLSEGVEFVDEEGHSLVDVVVVAGVPFPQPDDYTHERTRRLAERLGVSYYEALMRQAAIIVRQAVGRSIRRDGDSLIAILGDSRYRNPKWMKLLRIKLSELVYSTVDLLEKTVRTRLSL